MPGPAPKRAAHRRRAAGRALIGALALGLAPWGAGAAEPAPSGAAPVALVAVIIDDLGYRLDDGIAALELPGALSYSFLPGAPYARRLAVLAHQLDRDVLVHLPMESEHPRRLGPVGLRDGMDRGQVLDEVRAGIAAIPHAIGLSNHMGSLLTARPEPMRWLMQALRSRGDLFFVDSRTTAASVAEAMATAEGVPSIRRDVFLDHDPTPRAVARQFTRLVDRARRRGTALAVGHPYPETLAVLRGMLPTLAGHGIRLVPVSQLLHAREPRFRHWRAALSR